MFLKKKSKILRKYDSDIFNQLQFEKNTKTRKYFFSIYKEKIRDLYYSGFFYYRLKKEKELKQRLYLLLDLERKVLFHFRSGEKLRMQIKRRTRYGKWILTLRQILYYYNNFSKKTLIKISKKSRKSRFYMLDSFVYRLECRLDSILLRLSILKSKFEIRHLINSGSVLVNGKAVTYCNFLLKPYDFLSFKPSEKKRLFRNIVLNLKEKQKFSIIPPMHIEANYKIMTFLLIRKHINVSKLSYPFEVNLNKLIMNYKSFN